MDYHVSDLQHYCNYPEASKQSRPAYSVSDSTLSPSSSSSLFSDLSNVDSGISNQSIVFDRKKESLSLVNLLQESVSFSDAINLVSIVFHFTFKYFNKASKVFG